MMKRLLVFIVAIMGYVGAWAYDFMANGIAYKIKSANEVSVTYTKFLSSGNYSGLSGNITIPSQVTYNSVLYKVTSIGDGAFYGCSGLTSVTIPSSVTSIGDKAFDGCSGLVSVTIPNSVASIGDGAFYGCSSLTSVTIPNSVTSIGAVAFAHCSGLTSVTIGNSVTSIGNAAFRDCSGLTSVTIPNSVTSIGADAFLGCSGLTSVTIGNSVTSIGSQAFLGCSGLTSVTIPSSVTSIGDYAFSGCWMTSVTFHCQNVGTWFKGFTSIKEVHIGNEVSSIESNAFQGCSNLTAVHISDLAAWCGIDFKNANGNPLSVAGHLYLNSQEVTDLVIPNSVTTIKFAAFYGCKGLTSVTIGNSVTSIGDKAFYGCSGLTSVKVVVTNRSAFINNNVGNLVKTAIGKPVVLIDESGNEIKNFIIPNDITAIGDYAFQNCSGLTSVTIPSSVTSIGGSAFSGCSGLTSVKVVVTNRSAFINNNVGNLVKTAIGKPVVLIDESGNEIKDYIIPNDITAIGDAAFYNCSGLTSVTIPSSVTSIGYSAFFGCSGLTSVKVVVTNRSAFINNNVVGNLYNVVGTYVQTTFGKPVVLIDESGNEIKNFIIPNDITAIGDAVFYNCSGLTSVTIPNSVTSIGAFAFSGCSGLTSVTIPNSVTSIGTWAFFGCSGLTSVTIPSSVTAIGDKAFYQDLHSVISALTSVKVVVTNRSAFINNNVGNLVKTVFGKPVVLMDESGNEIKNFIIPNDITAIGNNAFFNCSGLTSVTIPSSVTSIGSNAFDGCSGLASVTVRVLDYSAFLTNGVCNLLRSAFVNDKPVVLIDGSGNEIKNFIIPSDITTIGLNAFLCCSGLTSVTIPNNVTSIGQGAFYGCSGLTSVDIPNSVTTIGDYAFQNCSGLPTLTIPNSITSIGNKAFDGCWMTSVTFHCQNVGTWFKGFTSIKEVHIGNEVSSIESNAFQGCSNLTAVHVSDLAAWCGIGFENAYGNPLSAGGHLFLNSQEVTDLIIPNSVTTIKFAAFFGCKGLTSVTIPSNVESIKKSAFCSCSNLTSAVIGNSVTSIGDYAFYECSGLTSLTIPSSVTAIGDKAFYQNNYSVISALTSVKVAVANRSAFVSNNVGNLVKTAIGKPVVLIDESGNEIKDYTIPDVITAIGDNAFYNCSGLTSVVIPNSVTSIGDYAFSNCSGLTRITVNAENPAYDSRNGCNAIIETASGTLIAGCMNTVIPEGVTAIADYAFYGSTLLTSIDIPEGVTSIGNSAFYNCNWLASVTIPSSVTSIGNSAFSGCAHLTAVTVGLTAPLSISSDVFSNRANATLYVPIGSKTAFMLADVWKEFKEIVEVNIQAGQTLDLTELPVMTVGDEPYVLPATTMEGQPLTWTVDDGTVASIDGNVLTPLRAGTAIVTATQEGNDDYKSFSREFCLTVEGVAGDLNNDGGVNIADIVLIIDVMSGENNDASMRQIADITGDGDVNIADIIAAIDLMIAQTDGSSPNNAPAHMAAMQRNSDYITARMDGDVMSIGLNNVNDYTAFQMTVTLPEGASISDIVLDEGRCGKHVASVSQLNDRQYLVTAYSLSNKRLNGSAGKLFSLHTERLNGEATISDVIFATPEAKPCLLDGATVMGTATGIGGIDSQSADHNVYDLQGRHISGKGQSTMVNAPLKKGVYIVNGKKVVKK